MKKKAWQRDPGEIQPLLPSDRCCGDKFDCPFDSKHYLLSNKGACRSLHKEPSDAALLKIAQTLILGPINYCSSISVTCVWSGCFPASVEFDFF